MGFFDVVCYSYDCQVSGLCPLYIIPKTYTAGLAADFFCLWGGGGGEYLMVDQIQQLSNHNFRVHAIVSLIHLTTCVE